MKKPPPGGAKPPGGALGLIHVLFIALFFYGYRFNHLLFELCVIDDITQLSARTEHDLRSLEHHRGKILLRISAPAAGQHLKIPQILKLNHIAFRQSGGQGMGGGIQHRFYIRTGGGTVIAHCLTEFIEIHFHTRLGLTVK